MKFIYFNPVRIYFDINFVSELKTQIKNKNTLILTTKSFLSKAEMLKKEINASKILLIPQNPQIQFIKQTWDKTRGFKNIIALGGGSVIDAAKAFCLQISFSEFEGILKFGILDSIESKANIYAIPTTSGSGSELTPWATIWDKMENKKYSLHLDNLFCKAAFYDISLMLNMPLNLTIHTALDALSHSMESIWNKNANPISTQYANYAIRQILTTLPKIVKILESNKISKTLACKRKSLALASINAALAFSNTKTALAHAISYPLSMKFNMPHGLACSFTLPLLLECLLDSNNIESSALNNAKKILKTYQKPLNNLFKTLNISTDFKSYNVTKKDINEIFTTLNPRADNFLLESNIVKKYILDRI